MFAVRGQQRLSLYVFALVIFLAIYAGISALAPVGGEDAFTIWNLRAKHIAFDETIVAGIQDTRMAHPDYPPLMPLAIGLVWRVTGFTQVIPILIHGLIFAGFLYVAFRVLPFWAFLIVGVVGLFYSNWQYADLLLAGLLLAAFYSYIRGQMLLTGVLVGLLFLTKNEGELQAAVFVTLLLILTRRLPRRFLLGHLVPGLLLIVFKLLVTVPNDVVGSEGILSRILDPQRYLLIASYVVRMGAVWQMGVVPLVLALALLMHSPVRKFPLLVVAVIALGYFMIYAITPHDLQWHLSTSYDRLLLHLFPTLVFALTDSAYLKAETLPTEALVIHDTLKSPNS